MKSVRIVLIGLGGYGGYYLSLLLSDQKTEPCELVAGVDPFPERCDYLDELQAKGIRLFKSLDDLLNSGMSADLAIVVSPIQMHAPQTCALMKAGIDVLCEKPAAGCIQDIEKMIACRDQTRRKVGIGYQHSFSPDILRLKQDIISGIYGAPISVATRILCSRPLSYYRRNNWAGCIRNQNGDWLLDSPVNNASAHFLHNMLFLLGKQKNRSASAKSGGVPKIVKT